MSSTSGSSGQAAVASPLEALPIHEFRGTPEEVERQWYERVYQGRGDRMRQLSWRAVITSRGSALLHGSTMTA
jgi:hypothetical protein